jgi:hypothetical protein
MVLKFNRLHKNGWVSFRIAGVPGAVFVDKKMLTPEQLASLGEGSEIEVNGLQFAEAKAGAQELDTAKAQAKAEKEAAKAAKAATVAAKAAEKLAKLEERKAKAEAALAKAQAAAAAPAVVEPVVEEQPVA